MQHGIDRVFEVERLTNVVLHRLERLVVAQLREVGGRPGHQVVDTHDLPAVCQEPLAEVRSEKTRAARDDRPQYRSGRRRGRRSRVHASSWGPMLPWWG